MISPRANPSLAQFVEELGDCELRRLPGSELPPVFEIVRKGRKLSAVIAIYDDYPLEPEVMDSIRRRLGFLPARGEDDL